MSFQTVMNVEIDLDDYREELIRYAEDFLEMIDLDGIGTPDLAHDLKSSGRLRDLIGYLQTYDPEVLGPTAQDKRLKANQAVENIEKISANYTAGILSLGEYLSKLHKLESEIVVYYSEITMEPNNE